MASKILLADDSITIQKVVNLTFAEEGIEVVAVSNGDQAEKRLGEVNPDIVLADIFMPGKNGYELCEYIKQSAEYAKLPVVLLVGAFEPFDEDEARRVGADAHMTKPFESRVLVETVRNLIGRGAGGSGSLRPEPQATGNGSRFRTSPLGSQEPAEPNLTAEQSWLQDDVEQTWQSPPPAEPSLHEHNQFEFGLASERVEFDSPSPQIKDTKELSFLGVLDQFSPGEFGGDPSPGSEPTSEVPTAEFDARSLDSGETDVESTVPASATPADADYSADEMLLDLERLEGNGSGDNPPVGFDTGRFDESLVSPAEEWTPGTPDEEVLIERLGSDPSALSPFESEPEGTGALLGNESYSTIEGEDQPLGDLLGGDGLVSEARETDFYSFEPTRYPTSEGGPDARAGEEGSSGSVSFETEEAAELDSSVADDVLLASAFEMPERFESPGVGEDAVLDLDDSTQEELDPAARFLEQPPDQPKRPTKDDTEFTTADMWSRGDTSFESVDLDQAETGSVDEDQAEGVPREETGFEFTPVVTEASEVEIEAPKPSSASAPAWSEVELSEAVIEEIVRRVVAQISDSVVREVAWDIVPDCVERVVNQLTREGLSRDN